MTASRAKAAPPVATAAPLVSLRRMTWWTVLGCLALVVGLPVADSTDAGSTAAVVVTAVAATVAAAVAGRLFAVAVRGAPRPAALRGLVAVAALGAAGVLVLGRATAAGAFPWVLPLAALLAAVSLGAGWPRWEVWSGGAGLTSAAALAGSGSTGAASWTAVSWSAAAVDTAITMLCAGALVVQVWVLDVADRLDRARALERAAAVAAERLRFAADLHDIQGHSLQVIALKSELAERLLAADPARAGSEMRDVQALALQTLGDTRDVVRGYRRVSLETETTNARRVLHAAGIDASLSRDADLPTLPAPVENLLGLVVRECTTNVLRHSAAGHCEIVLAVDGDTVALRFTNDTPLDGPVGAAGGLADLADRLTAAGGRLDTRATAETFTVDARLPVRADR